MLNKLLASSPRVFSRALREPAEAHSPSGESIFSENRHISGLKPEPPLY